MKIEWLVTDLTSVRSPDRADCAILGMILGWALFWPIQAVFLVGEAFCDIETPS